MAPLPKPGARRPDRGSGAAVVLPRGGRRGSAPAWPLPEPTDRERELWRRLWRSPQSTQWTGCHLTVARYVRTLVRAELPAASAPILAEAHQLEDRLGLSPTGMARLRWTITDDMAPVLALSSDDVRSRLHQGGD